MVNQNREEGQDRLSNNYFSPNSIYTDTQSQKRFHMQMHLFLQVVEALNNHDEYSQMMVNATRRNDLSPLQKCTIAICILTYGSPTDSVDEYIWIAETTIMECLQIFVLGICAIFGDEYLRRPNDEDTRRLLQMGVTCDF